MSVSVTRPLIKLTVFTTVTVLLIVVLGAVISNSGHSGSRPFAAVFTDATGVLAGDDVRLAGVTIGEVRSVHLQDRTQARIDFTIESGVPIYVDVQAQIRYQNLIGQRYLALVESPQQRTQLPVHSVIPVTRTTPALNLTVLFNGFKPLFEALQPAQVNTLAGEVISTLQGEGSTVAQLLADTASLTATLASKDAVFGQVVDNLNTVLATVDARDTQVTRLITSFRQLMSGLAQDRSTIDTALPQVSDLIDATTGLLTGARPPLKSDIANLNTLAGQLADTKGTLDTILKALPNKLNVLTRTASYGSWFNFYLCGADVHLSLLGKAITLTTPVTVQTGDAGTVCPAGTS